MSRIDWLSTSCASLRGSPPIPGDKSISHRALMLAAIAEGVSNIDGFLEGEDTCSTQYVLQQLGVHIDSPGTGRRTVQGVGLHGLRAPESPLDCGNAGTGMRLFAGLLAGQDFDCILVGDASLSRRPMQRVIEPLSRMGARIEATGDGLPPLRIIGGQLLRGVEYNAKIASAQVKSALLLAGLYADGESTIIESQPTRDYTERMLEQFGWPIQYASGRSTLTGGHRLRASDVSIPVDFSSAAFFIVAASIVPGSRLVLHRVGINPRRTGLVQALRLMGAKIEIEPIANAVEEVGTITIRHASLHGVEIPTALVADMIDELPALMIAAAAASGTTRIRGAGELRFKESDRIAVMARGLAAIGVSVHELSDGIDIVGSDGTLVGGGTVSTDGDHRIAMSFAVAGAIANSPIRIEDCAAVATSFPGFIDAARAAGLSLCDADA